MRIQHNVMAMNAYRNYNNNTSALSKNLEKLSSGYKINRAGDDAAGLAISEKMRAQITGLKQAQDNAKSGRNLVQTAEGALQEVHDMLNRMVKLADQSANGTYDNEIDRKALQDEVTELKDEINRISKAANYNGIKLLDGSMDATGKVDNVALDGSLTATDGKAAVAEIKPEFSVDLDGFSLAQGTATEKGKKVNLTIGNKKLSATVDLSAKGANASDIANLFNGKTLTYTTGVKFTISAEGSKLTFKWKSGTVNSDATFSGLGVSLSYTGAGSLVHGTINSAAQIIQQGQVAEAGSLGGATLALTAGMLVDGAVFKIGSQTFRISYSKSGNGTAGAVVGSTIYVKDLLKSGALDPTKIGDVAGRITKAVNGTNTTFTVGHDSTGSLRFQVRSTYDNSTGKFGDLSKGDNIKAAISVGVPGTNGGHSLVLQIGDTSDDFNQMSLNIGAVDTVALGINDISVALQDNAKAAVSVVKDAINQVSGIRAKLGATQNRLDHTLNNLSVMTENIQDAEATIRDTDVAEEMMAYTKNNILVQSAQAMLAQANQVPQGVLQLLQ